MKCSIEKNFSSALSLLTAKTKELSIYSSKQNEYDEYDGYKDQNYEYIEIEREKEIAKEPIYAVPHKQRKKLLTERDTLQEKTESDIQQGMIKMKKDLIITNQLTTLIDQIIYNIKEKGFNAKFLVIGESKENKVFRALATHLNLLNTGNDFINQSFHPYYSKEFLIDEGDKIKLIDFGDQSTYDNKLSQLSEPQTKKLKEELLEELNRLKELCNKTAETLLKDEDQSEISIPRSSQSILITHSSFHQPAGTSSCPPPTIYHSHSNSS